MKTLISLLLCMGCSGVCAAHDFWLQPHDFWVQPDVPTPITLQVGHGPFRQRSPIPAGRITRFEAITPNGARLDLRNRLHPGDGSEDGDIQLAAPGTYLLILETDNRAQSHLPALRFNDYLRVEGLTPALEQRTRTDRMAADGSECYSRRAKVIVQVGNSTARADAWRLIAEPIGLPLEIVPEVNPYTEPRPASLPVRVMYEGRPLGGALVKLTQLEHDATPFESHLTDSAGRAVFHMPNEGSWLLNVIWTKPLPRTRETDFETVFSSLSFGFSGGGGGSARADQALKLPGRAAVGLSERRRKMTVARETEVQAERREVIVSRQEVESAGEPQAQLVSVQRHTFNLLEYLGEVHGGDADFGRDLGQSPAPTQVRCQDELGPVDELLPSRCSTRRVRGALTQCTSYESKHQGLRFQGLGDGPALQPMSQQCDQRLSTRIDTKALPAERQ